MVVGYRYDLKLQNRGRWSRSTNSRSSQVEMYRKTIRAGEISRKRQEVAHGRGRTIQVPLYMVQCKYSRTSLRVENGWNECF